jgi:hypothetical protein
MRHNLYTQTSAWLDYVGTSSQQTIHTLSNIPT